MSIFSEIKEVVTTREAAEFYGYRVSRSGMVRCPFHNDRTPSMKVDRNFICFGCQEKGDVIRFVEKLFGLTPYEAAQKLINDFKLNIPVNGSGKSPPVKQRVVKTKESEKEWRRENLFRETVNRMVGVYCSYYKLLNEWRINYAPSSPLEERTVLFEEALNQADYVEYLLEVLQMGSAEDKAALIIDKGKEVKTLENRIAEYR